jgi:hypothetical protein
MFGRDLDSYPSTGVEIDLDPAPARGESSDQVVEEQICEMFVEDAFVPVAPEVELEGFRFDDFLIGDVPNENFGEVRLPGFRT